MTDLVVVDFVALTRPRDPAIGGERAREMYVDGQRWTWQRMA